jgi:hypothetical protein
MHLVLLETSGNQHYIFSTNKLRENVGASQLTYLAGTQFVLEVVEAIGGPKGLWSDRSIELRANLSDPDKNVPINRSQTQAEVILATSGKALVLVKDNDTAKKLVEKVTLHALKEAPGLDLCGVVSKVFDWDKEPLHEIVKSVHNRYEEVRASRTSPQERFQLFPIIELCLSSGLPAADAVEEGEDILACSRTSLAKRKRFDPWFKRIQRLIEDTGFKLVRNIDKLEKDLNWIAVVHGDGNGLGQIMLKFHEHADTRDASKNRDYVDKLRRFSLALEGCTEEAFKTALSVFPPSKKGQLPLVPLILGGDDLTVVCHGAYAIPFTRRFLQEFESQTARRDNFDSIIPEIADKALGADHLSACAGIAITKPHFPFHSGYDLAEALLGSAKTVKKQVQGKKGPYPCSAIDFHALYDASGVDFDVIRARLQVDDGNTLLTAKPYVVTSMTDAWVKSVVEGCDWAKAHHIDELDRRIEAITAEEEGRRKLPNSQLHDLREGLFLGYEGADARMKLMRHRYADQGLNELLESREPEPSLFRVYPEGKRKNRLLDAMDVVEFWGKG